MALHAGQYEQSILSRCLWFRMIENLPLAFPLFISDAADGAFVLDAADGGLKSANSNKIYHFIGNST